LVCVRLQSFAFAKINLFISVRIGAVTNLSALLFSIACKKFHPRFRYLSYNKLQSKNFRVVKVWQAGSFLPTPAVSTETADLKITNIKRADTSTTVQVSDTTMLNSIPQACIPKRKTFD